MTEREKALVSLLAEVHLELKGVYAQLTYVQGVSSRQVEVIRQFTQHAGTVWH